MTEIPLAHDGLAPRLLVDRTAGRLARRLRLLGLDVEYVATCEPAAIVRRARQEGRTVATRNRAVAERVGGSILLKSEHLTDQMKQLVADLRLARYNLFSRCSLCNARLESVSKESIKGRIPRYVYLTHDEFAACPVCGRYYWRGTHWQHMLGEIHSALEAEDDGQRGSGR